MMDHLDCHGRIGHIKLHVHEKLAKKRREKLCE